MEIPELEFELGMGALGGKFTTLEGLLKDVRDLVSGLGELGGIAVGLDPLPRTPRSPVPDARVPSPGCLAPLSPALLWQVERNPFTLGDSSVPGRTKKLQEFIGKLQEVSAQALFCAGKR